MAFSFTKDNESVAGDIRVTGGTFTNAGGSTGGDIRTGMGKTQGMILQQKGSAVIASQAVVNETFPLGDPLTIVTASDTSGYWLAFGY